MIQSGRHESVYQCRYIFRLPFCSTRIMKKTPWCIATTFTEWQITKLQDGWGWKGLLSSSSLPTSVQAGPHSCPGEFFNNICKDGYSTTSLGNLFQCLFTLIRNRNVSWCSDDPSSVSFCAHSLWSCLWAPLETAGLCPLCVLPSVIYTHEKDPPEPPLLKAKQSQPSQPFLISKVLLAFT